MSGRDEIRCSAPGKLLLGGEYAVLHQAPAVVASASPRAVARLSGSRRRGSPVVEACVEEVRRHLEGGGVGDPGSARPTVATTDFRRDGRKIGLGSSAAVAAAATGALLERAGRPVATHREELLAVAGRAHRRAQQGRGSGVDVAAAVHGGFGVFRVEEPFEPIPALPHVFAPVWTGGSVRTAEMLDAVDRLGARDPRLHRGRIDDLRALAGELADAYRRGEFGPIAELTRRYGAAMDRLGRAAGAPIVTAEHAAVSRLADELGGAAKPSGAGGGEIIVALFDDKVPRERFDARCRELGFAPLDLELGVDGARRDDRAGL